jgi:hypothetical protein
VSPSGARLSYERIVGVLNTAVALGLAFHLASELASPREIASTDFTVFRTGWELILDGRAGELYDATAQEAVQTALLAKVGSHGFQAGMMAFLHPPHAALAGCALGLLARHAGVPPAFCLWTAMSLWFLARLARLVSDELGGGRGATALVGVTLAAFYPTLEALQQGQVSALLALAALACAISVRERRAWAAALWMLALSIKPQTLPPVLIVLAARREWRVLTRAAAVGLVAFGVSSLVLGWRIWPDYLTHLPALERYFGVGTPDHMPTLRGLLTRVLGEGARRGIDLATLVTWAAALGAAAFAALRTRGDAEGRGAWAFAMAAGAITSPHLFPQDVLLWVAPVALVLALSQQGDDAVFRVRSRIVLAWPLWFVLARALDIRDTPRARLPIDLLLVPLGLATAWAWRAVVGAQRTPPSAARLT